jgi:hypothetical protein
MSKPHLSQSLAGALAVSACSKNQRRRPRRRRRDQCRRGHPVGGAVRRAIPGAGYPQPAVVIPPRPKPGAPHGPGFDMPLIDVEGYMPARPMDAEDAAFVRGPP